MLDILRDAVCCMRSEEDVKGFKLLMPSPCCGSGGFNLQEWQAFVEELQPGDFQQSVVHWCVHMERDYYKQYIQALHPDNQVDIYEGRVVLE